jgi:4-hydroxybenzoate polyprenyltransferase
MAGFRAYLALARPTQWVKNGFVLTGLLFGHAWSDPRLVAGGLACFIGFCLVSSAVYAFNDVVDRDADRTHPNKRNRPVASGAVGVGGALVFAAALAVAGLLLQAEASLTAFLLTFCYIGLNLGYSLGLKHVAGLDVIIISAGFMLRILAGTLGVGIEPSRWLLICGFMLTLFLGFAKRRAELAALHADSVADGNPRVDAPGTSRSSAPTPTRPVLATYRLVWLDRVIAVCACGAVVAYAAYTLDPGTIELHGTSRLVVTVPVVAYGIGRYLWTLYRRGQGADPATQMWRDPHLFGAIVCWLALTGWLIRGA